MNKAMNRILKEALEKVDPPKEDLDFIDASLKNLLEILKKEIKKLKIKTEIFVGGSFAKKTMIKKDVYDIDVFVRFSQEYEDKKIEISKLLNKILDSMAIKKINIAKIHGSRDYFRIGIRHDFFIELIPVTKIKIPREARNITDLSYSHVNYIKKRVKSEKVRDDIRIAKAFCYANGCYGAESYIKGFSGYGLELLIYHYKSFVKFLKAMAMANAKKQGLIIDIEKHYKNKNRVLIDMNASKLSSPIILVDPTFRQRNALAALSTETFKKFQRACKSFLRNPNIKAFEEKKVDLEKLKANAKKQGLEFIQLNAKTNKQMGDIAGSKLLKFFKYLGRDIATRFDIKHNGFGYNGKKGCTMYFAAKSRRELIAVGPFAKDKQAVAAFKKAHKGKNSKTYIKAGRIFARDKITFTLKDFLKEWMKNKNNKKTMKEMSIVELSIS